MNQDFIQTTDAWIKDFNHRLKQVEEYESGLTNLKWEVDSHYNIIKELRNHIVEVEKTISAMNDLNMIRLNQKQDLTLFDKIGHGVTWFCIGTIFGCFLYILALAQL